jgi:hypothetical protein
MQAGEKSGKGTKHGEFPGVVLWSDPSCSNIALHAARASGVAFSAAGSADEATARTLADALGIASFDDVRLGPEGVQVRALFAADQHVDLDSHARAGRSVFSLEPLEPAHAMPEASVVLGSFIGSAGFKAAAQVLPDFGAIASVHVKCHCGAGQGTLTARLHDALLTLQRLLGSPELLDAMLVAPNAAQSQEPARAHVEATPERLSDLAGDLGVLVRFQPRAIGLISASDQVSWRREVQVLGTRGTLDIDEGGVSWRDPEGAIIESHKPIENGFQMACSQVGSELLRHLQGAAEPVERVDPVLTYAACEAVRLSCRTRAPESVEKLRELLERT